MSKAIEYTMEIVVARLSNTNLQIDDHGGKKTAEFIEQIYNKLVELEKKDAESI